MSANGGAVALKVGIESQEKRTAGNGKPVDRMAAFAVSGACSDEFSRAAAFNGIFQPKGGRFGKVAGVQPAVKGFAGRPAAFGTVAARVIDGV